MAGLTASALDQLALPARWPPGEAILVWIDEARLPPVAPALIDRALETWTDASGGRVAFRKVAKEKSTLRIRFASSATHFGEALPQIDPHTGAIVAAEVAINADVPADPFEQRIVVYLTALHELGHALGLAHTDDFSSIMYRFRAPDDGPRYFTQYRQRVRSLQDIGSRSAPGLSGDDVRALRKLYDR